MGKTKKLALQNKDRGWNCQGDYQTGYDGEYHLKNKKAAPRQPLGGVEFYLQICRCGWQSDAESSFGVDECERAANESGIPNFAHH